MMKTYGIILAIASCIAIAAFGRTYSKVKCGTEACSYEDLIGEGPTKMRDWVTGHCLSCEQIVWRNWERHEEAQNRPPISKVWDHESGKIRNVFSCPHCEKPVLAIQAMQEIKHCPKCTSNKIEIAGPHIFRD